MSATNYLFLGTLNPVGSFQNVITLASGVEYGRTEASGTLYTGKATDVVIGCMFPAGGVVVLPSHLSNTFIIKDESGNAGSSNIVISGAPNIDGATGTAITTNYGSLTVYRSPHGWRTV
jgi:hypothetical protein